MCILWLKGFYLFYGISNIIEVIDQKNNWFNVVLIITSCYCIFFFLITHIQSSTSTPCFTMVHVF